MAKVVFDFDPERAGSLHCDACGYDAPEKIAITPDLIGTPCPQCGADMLTAADYQKTLDMIEVVQGINKAFGDLIGQEPSPKGGQPVQIKIHDDEITIRTDKGADAPPARAVEGGRG